MMISKAIFQCASLVAVSSLLLVASASAEPNPLLSGYGGPGQGSQVVLGGTLSGTPSDSSAAPGGPVSITVAGPAVAAPRAGVTGSRSSRAALGPRGSSKSPALPSRARREQALASGAYPPAALSGSAAASGVGLTGADDVLVVVALLALAITVLATRRLVRGRGPGGPRS